MEDTVLKIISKLSCISSQFYQVKCASKPFGHNIFPVLPAIIPSDDYYHLLLLSSCCYLCTTIDVFVYIVDDWGWDHIREGTVTAITAMRLTVLMKVRIYKCLLRDFVTLFIFYDNLVIALFYIIKYI